MGTIFGATRTITAEAIAACGRLTGDLGSHHVSGLAGKQMAQGLLTLAVAPLFDRPEVATTEMSVRFLAPVFAGEEITAVVEVTDSAEIPDGRVRLSCAISISNAEGVPVLQGTGVAELAAEILRNASDALSR
ncbi:MaoC family dehydratase [Actinokineospora sp.]|uniref:MaoC family dehydratase n=1 Tax=Actinokineospora sp. TaxID=1872133 RepID=UPI004037FFE8